jgi:hypothetical protein
MPKTIPFHIEVEEIAVGAFMRKLHEMPGIVKMDCLLGHGGEGPGRKQLEAAAHAKTDKYKLVAQYLMDGPRHIREISATVGGPRSRAYGIMHQLSKRHIAEKAGESGMWQLTARARARLGMVKALPAPAKAAATKITHGPGGRASPGSGNIVLRSILGDGAQPGSAIRARAARQGISPKSISGILERAKKNGLVRKNGFGYELTAKGMKIETGASHG